MYSCFVLGFFVLLCCGVVAVFLFVRFMFASTMGPYMMKSLHLSMLLFLDFVDALPLKLYS